MKKAPARAKDFDEMSDAEFLRWSKKVEAPKVTIGGLIHEARQLALENLAAAGYTEKEAARFEANGSLNGTVPNWDRKRDARISGSAGGWEAFWAVRVLDYCREFETAWKGERWADAARLAYMAGASKDRMMLKFYDAQFRRQGGTKTRDARRSNSGAVIARAESLMPELAKRFRAGVTIETLWDETTKDDGRGRMPFKTFARHWKKHREKKHSQ